MVGGQSWALGAHKPHLDSHLHPLGFGLLHEMGPGLAQWLGGRSEAKRLSTEHVLTHPAVLLLPPFRGMGEGHLWPLVFLWQGRVPGQSPPSGSAGAALGTGPGTGQGPKGSGRVASQSAIQSKAIKI